MKILSFQKLFSFGAGLECIGNNFAMYEMILAIIALVEQFEIIEKESLFK
jgi:cytochrome P450